MKSKAHLYFQRIQLWPLNDIIRTLIHYRYLYLQLIEQVFLKISQRHHSMNRFQIFLWNDYVYILLNSL